MEGVVNSDTVQRVVQDHSDTFWQDGVSLASSTAPDGIDSLSVDKNTFRQIFQDHWETFKATYPRFDTPDYDTAVQKMLDCGDPEKMGHVQYRCLWCGETRRFAFTCKSSFCLSCAQPRMSQWADFIGRRLFPGVTYRHFILTTPKFIRHWLYRCPDLLSEFMRRGYRHVPTGTLALLAQRLGKVFASPSTWYRLIRDHPWRRPRQRVHPAKPKIGIRASHPNDIWHIETTLIRLLDGSRAYLHAVIDNFSRRILAWKIMPTFEPGVSAEILLAASKGVDHGVPTVLADGGTENYNGPVDELVNSGLLHRVLAGTEITYSNSLIESWWRVLKHRWLFLNTLDCTRPPTFSVDTRTRDFVAGSPSRTH